MSGILIEPVNITPIKDMIDKHIIINQLFSSQQKALKIISLTDSMFSEISFEITPILLEQLILPLSTCELWRLHDRRALPIV